MKKQEYLDTLRTALTKLKVTDIDDIIAEYAAHFDFKLADGYVEEEIIAKLGKPNIVAGQYATGDDRQKSSNVNAPLVYSGLVTADIGSVTFFTFFAAWIVVLGAAVLGFLGIGFCFLFGVKIANIIPAMPYFNAFLLALPFLFLSVMSTAGTIYCSLYMKQFFKAYVRWHRNMVAIAYNKPVLPPLSLHPQLKPKTKRLLRNTLMISLIGFGITFIIAFAAASISTGSFEFWHVWKWFQ